MHCLPGGESLASSYVDGKKRQRADLRSRAGDGAVKESRSFIAPCEAVIAGGEGG